MSFRSRAYAQAVPDQLEEVVVTGSRITRRDYESNSPIVTVDSEAFESQMGLNFEAYLNQLPNYNPASSPTTSQGDVQITPVNSVGIASISLRGFGPNRSLVLVDGRRLVPINALMVTDINAIPSALIERVETITGGASAVYGADAVGGVTNFILRDDFEGFDIDMQYGTTDRAAARKVGSVPCSARISRMGAATSRWVWRLTIAKRSRRSTGILSPRATTTQTRRATSPSCRELATTTVCSTAPAPATVNGVFADRPPGTEVFSPLSGNFFRQFNFNPDARSVWVENSAAGLASYQGSPNWTFYNQDNFDASVPGNTVVLGTV